jgi:hypothetical protein
MSKRTDGETDYGETDYGETDYCGSHQSKDCEEERDLWFECTGHLRRL